jgi:hypothetical protein
MEAGKDLEMNSFVVSMIVDEEYSLSIHKVHPTNTSEIVIGYI